LSAAYNAAPGVEDHLWLLVLAGSTPVIFNKEFLTSLNIFACIDVNARFPVLIVAHKCGIGLAPRAWGVDAVGRDSLDAKGINPEVGGVTQEVPASRVGHAAEDVPGLLII
jgi:hypothetical protein